MRDAGVATDDAARVGDDGSQCAEVGAPGEHATLVQAGALGDRECQRALGYQSGR